MMEDPMTRNWIAAALALTVVSPAAAQAPAAELKLWRLDCGSVQVSDFDVFSDTYLYPGQPKQLTASCYLIKHGNQYMLWDTGVAGPSKEWVFNITLKERVTDQLKRIGIAPANINYVGISHYHDDHTGQAADFPQATLLIGTADWEAIKGRPATAARFTPWISGGAKVEPVGRDKDVFGDKSVTILDMPGHTPGHKTLLVRRGPVPCHRAGPEPRRTELQHQPRRYARLVRPLPGDRQDHRRQGHHPA
jgi:N-acyl homoserine lactone hydrolase